MRVALTTRTASLGSLLPRPSAASRELQMVSTSSMTTTKRVLGSCVHLSGFVSVDGNEGMADGEDGRSVRQSFSQLCMYAFIQFVE